MPKGISSAWRFNQRFLRKDSMDYSTTIRPECLRRADDGWEQPRGPEIREVIRRAGLTGSETAKLVGVSVQTIGGSRRVRKWISEESDIPYAAWAILCHVAGLGMIWIDESEPHA
jgi:hypothetical protein